MAFIATRRPLLYKPPVVASGLLDGSESDGTNILGTDPVNMASWLDIQISITANNTTSPDGNVTAEKIVDLASTTRHVVYTSGLSITANKTRTISVYAKIDTRRYLQIRQDGSDAFFDLQDGAVTDTNLSGSSSSPVTSIQAAANGFYKCTFQFFHTAGTDGFLNFGMSDVPDNSGTLVSGSPSYLGNGSGFWLWRPKCVVT